jgi:hypothetical protein
MTQDTLYSYLVFLLFILTVRRVEDNLFRLAVEELRCKQSNTQMSLNFDAI